MVPAFEGLRFLSHGESTRSVRALRADLKQLVLRTEEGGLEDRTVSRKGLETFMG